MSARRPAPLSFTRQHVFRIVAPADMGRFPIRLTEVEAVWSARNVPLPAPDDRSTPDQYAAVSMWFCEFPHVTPLGDRFALVCVSLRDIKGVPPAHKQFPDATHELALYAVSPDTTAEQWRKGEWSPMLPINYVEHFVTPWDHVAAWVCERAAESFVDGRFPVESCGIRGAKKLFRDNVREWERQAKSVFKPGRGAGRGGIDATDDE